jgi:hypothetical protein
MQLNNSGPQSPEDALTFLPTLDGTKKMFEIDDQDRQKQVSLLAQSSSRYLSEFRAFH